MADTKQNATHYPPYTCDLENLAEFLMRQPPSIPLEDPYGFYWLSQKSNRSIADTDFRNWTTTVARLLPSTKALGCNMFKERDTSMVYFCMLQLKQ
ncbi:hypothetical protein OESDEN_17869 [Oesophagostomum dentatum]|uniref:Uncharacterized protein n=1 Tax=Oesophagostomum dentatum TaxID=61180 RepID=A0A0B1SFW6_OESDE|nr:hypothetical protein OESDEN_17869 [Oesophagostomum dentatum]